MAKEICNLLDKLEGKRPKKCDAGCKYYKFAHLKTPCVLSGVYSVDKGEDCYIYEPKKEQAS